MLFSFHMNLIKKYINNKYLILSILLIYIIIMLFGFIIFIPKNATLLNNNDKFIHFIEFFILTILSLKTFQLFKFKHYYLLSIILISIFTVISESIQYFIPYRSFSYYDMIADVVGIIFGLGVFKWIFSKL